MSMYQLTDNKKKNITKKYGAGKIKAIARWYEVQEKNKQESCTFDLNRWKQTDSFRKELKDIKKKQEKNANTVQSFTTCIHKVHGSNKRMNSNPLDILFEPVERKPSTIFEKPKIKGTLSLKSFSNN